MLKKKKCKYCGVLFSPRTSLQKNCFHSDCIKKFYEENKAKISKVTTNRKQAERKELKEKMLTISQLKQRARTPFQKWIRLRDSDKPCISCGSNSDKVDAGHFKKAEVYFGLTFDKDNVHSQCQKCNRYLGGNEANYRQGLVARFGEQFVLDIEKRADETRDYKHSREELEEIKNYYLKKLRDAKRDIV